ncbi:MAG: hypothetical protein R2824_04390 [Saprospiraceae bacterium]|nr:hypothetical protein [Lewinella sp.]
MELTYSITPASIGMWALSFWGNRFSISPRTLGQSLEGYGSKYNQLNAALPVGLGLRLWGIEGSTCFLFTDYLDDVSNTPVIYQDIFDGNGPEAAALSNLNIVPESDEALATNRRRDARMDGYYFLNLTLTYRTDGGRMGIRVRKNCPTFFGMRNAWRILHSSPLTPH